MRIPEIRLIRRQDTPLAVALIVGTATMFAQPLRFVLSVAEDVSRTYHIDLIPGFCIFLVVTSVHAWEKYRAAAREALVSTAKAAHAIREADAMNRLVTAARLFGSATDSRTFVACVTTHLPLLLGPAAPWLAVRRHDTWDWVLAPDAGADALLDAAPAMWQRATSSPCSHEGWSVFPIGAAGEALGLLGVREEAARSVAETSRIHAIASLIGVAVRNVQLVEELKTTGATDSLTGCMMRRQAFEILGTELKRARRNRSALSVLMLDVDRFKQINDYFGHPAGDRLLAALGSVLLGTLRASDVKCRYGGDEFLILLPDTGGEGAERVAANIRNAVQRLALEEEMGIVRCGVSIGIAVANETDADPMSLIRRADAALYKAKVERAGPREHLRRTGADVPQLVAAAS